MTLAEPDSGLLKPNEFYPDPLSRRENELLRLRRGEEGADLSDSVEPLGVALSGGGIRSATFSLGVFQALANADLLRRVDLLSTVSGGGYFGAFLSTLFARDKLPGTGTPGTSKAVTDTLRPGARSQPVENLRENGRYLAPSGSGDLLLGGAVLLRNWVAVQIVLLTLVMTGLLLAQSIVFQFGFDELPFASFLHRSEWLWWSPWVLLAAAVFVLVAFPFGWAYWLTRRQRWLLHPALGVTTLGILGIVLWRQGTGKWWMPQGWSGLGLVLAATAVLTLLAWILAELIGWHSGEELREGLPRNLLSKWLKYGLLVAATLGALGMVDTLSRTVYLLQKAELFSVWWSGVWGAIVAAAGFARRIAVFFSTGRSAARPGALMSAAATAGAVVLLVAILVLCNLFALGLTWEFGLPKDAPACLLLGSSDVVATAPQAGSQEAKPNENQSSPQAEHAANSRLEKPTAGPVSMCDGKEPGCAKPLPAPRTDSKPPWIYFLVALAFSVLFGYAPAFLNRSGHHLLYAARLARAYLGASNEKRGPATRLNEVVENDEVAPFEYWSESTYRRGAPLHLINVTVNETVDGSSGIQQQDRKGLGMAIGPCGLHLGTTHHLLRDATAKKMKVAMNGGFRVFRGEPNQPEPLSIGRWVAISGAAFSTGTGYRTSFGLSFLAGFGNVRLGYWWNSDNPYGPLYEGQDKKPSRWSTKRLLYHALPIQYYLISEFLARFPGTAKRLWYLSDGGHFENMGAYELVRRRLKRIVIVDAECDPDYTFEGLANLVRKSRLDFGTEISFWEDDRFFDRKELEEPRAAESYEVERLPRFPVGTLADLRRPTRDGVSKAYAALADVSFPGDSSPSGRLLYVKAAMSGSEPPDVHQYHSEHPDFPHETTADQSFDEAQWESYRKLGQCIGDRLFEVPQVSGPTPQPHLRSVFFA